MEEYMKALKEFVYWWEIKPQPRTYEKDGCREAFWAGWKAAQQAGKADRAKAMLQATPEVDDSSSPTSRGAGMSGRASRSKELHEQERAS